MPTPNHDTDRAAGRPSDDRSRESADSLEAIEATEEALRAQLDTWREELARLRTRARGTSDEAWRQWKQHIDHLESMIDEARAQVRKLRARAGRL